MHRWPLTGLAMLLIFVNALSANAQLQPGDVVVTGVQSDGTDRFVWVPLVDLSPGQSLFFTDSGWNAAEGMFQRQVNALANPSTTAPSGGAIRYTAPPEGLSAGTVVEVRIDSRTAGEPGTYTLTVTGANDTDFSAANDTDIVGDQGISISTSGDQILIFTGSTTTPTFIYGVNTGANQWDLGSTTSQHASDVPTGLMNGATAVAIGTGPNAGDETDNGRYTGISTGSKAAILADVSNLANWEISDTGFEDLTNGITAFNISDDVPLPDPDGTVTVMLDTVFVEPGQETKLDITVDNTSSRAMGGLQFDLFLGEAQHLVIGDLIKDVSLEGFQINTNRSADGDTLKVIVYSATGDSIAPGRHTLANLYFNAQTDPLSDILGASSTITVIDQSLIVSDASGQTMASSSTNGAVLIGQRGDINQDGIVDVRDLIVFVIQLLGKGDATLPEPGTPAFVIADVNKDNELNIGDVVAIVNHILDLPLGLPKTLANQPANIHLMGMVTRENEWFIPVEIQTPQSIAGAQMTFTFDPGLLSVGTPRLPEASDHIGFDSHTDDGVLNVVIYSLSKDRSLITDQTPVLWIPVQLIDEKRPATLSLTDPILVNHATVTVPLRKGTMTQSISKNVSAPSSFGLKGNAPNPFNPTTSISYEVSEQAHITLTVYNLLGQQVVRLVDQEHGPGQYTIKWNGKNSRGFDVTSGVYLYQMISDTGFSETKRMTLLK